MDSKRYLGCIGRCDSTVAEYTRGGNKGKAAVRAAGLKTEDCQSTLRPSRFVGAINRISRDAREFGHLPHFLCIDFRDNIGSWSALTLNRESSSIAGHWYLVITLFEGPLHRPVVRQGDALLLISHLFNLRGDCVNRNCAECTIGFASKLEPTTMTTPR